MVPPANIDAFALWMCVDDDEYAPRFGSEPVFCCIPLPVGYLFGCIIAIERIQGGLFQVARYLYGQPHHSTSTKMQNRDNTGIIDRKNHTIITYLGREHRERGDTNETNA